MLLCTYWIFLFGLPDQIVSDRGSHFSNSFTDVLFSRFGIQHSLSSAYHPQTNGQTECTNSTVEVMLCHCVSRCQTDWMCSFPTSTSQSTTVCTKSHIIYHSTLSMVNTRSPQVLTAYNIHPQIFPQSSILTAKWLMLSDGHRSWATNLIKLRSRQEHNPHNHGAISAALAQRFIKDYLHANGGDCVGQGALRRILALNLGACRATRNAPNTRAWPGICGRQDPGKRECWISFGTARGKDKRRKSPGQITACKQPILFAMVVLSPPPRSMPGTTTTGHREISISNTPWKYARAKRGRHERSESLYWFGAGLAGSGGHRMQ
jgi:hypothetical protein